MRKILALVLGLSLFVSPTLAADSTVSAMTAASALSGPELFYCVQGGADRKCTATQLQTFAGGLAAGSNTQIQYNSSGSLAGSAGLTWDDTNKYIYGDQSANSGLAIRGGGSIGQYAEFLGPALYLYSGSNVIASINRGNTKSFANTTDGVFTWGPTTTNANAYGATTFLSSPAAASVQLGDVDAAAPVAQTLGVQSVVGGTSNTAGADFTIAGSKSTGTGAGGSIIFKTAPAGGSGTSQNALATALTIDSTKLVTAAQNIVGKQIYTPTQTLTDGATITFDANSGAVGTVTIAATGRTLTPSNLKAGGTYVIFVKQDATGSRTITTWTNFKWVGGTAPTLSTAANAVDIITGVSDGTYLYATAQTNFQ